ncbi:MAG: hypothetical protein ABSE95_04010 [Thermodesulfobacteriota bacterium]
MVLILPITALSSIQDLPHSYDADSSRKNDSSFQTLINRLDILDEPVSREGTGVIIAQAPGERYRLQFRLIARGPEACRLEIFDPFGRPMLYLVSYLGETHLFSVAQKKEIPFNQSLFGPWPTMAQIPVIEMLKLFWGRVPLLSYDSHQIDINKKEGEKTVNLILLGPVRQVLLLTQEPFTLIKSQIINRSKDEYVEIVFSDFSEVAGNRTPMQFEIKDGTGGNVLTIRYETLILRPDISDEIFKLSKLSDS